MDWKRIDWARRSGGPIEADLIEAYAQGKINRRNFVKRGTIIGLSMPMMGAVIAACGGSDEASPSTDGAPSTEGSSDGGEAPTTDAAAPAAAAGGSLVAGVQFGDAGTGLNPVTMLDLGTYPVCSQAFEYLVGLGDDGNIAATALATDWSPNEDGTVWTFNLREGASWQESGDPFTSADVAATIDRMVDVGAGLAGVVSAGAVETPDDLTAVINLDSANGNLPVLLSLFNPQSLITPVDYDKDTTLDQRPTGTGAWMLDSFDATTFRSKFVPNPNWWGGSVKLDSFELLGFEGGGSKVAAFASGEIDIIQDFSVADGSSLLTDDSVTVLQPPSTNHRKLFMNTQLPADSPFTDARVRQAVAYAVNRQQIVDTVYEGQAALGNDHPVSSALPYFDDSQEQREFDPEKAKSLLAEAGFADGFETTLQVGDLGEIPAIARIIEQNLAAVGITAPVSVTPNSDFYGAQWCLGPAEDTQPCGASAPIGLVDYGHRPTPDVFFARALETNGDWNETNYSSAEFDGFFKDYQSAVDVEGQATAVAGIQAVLHEDTPSVYHTFFNYLSAHSNDVAGFQTTALGHLQMQNTTITQ